MEVLIYLAIAFLCYWISGVIHELGHVFAGIINGWEFTMLVVGPIGIKRREDNKIIVYLEKNPLLWGGVGAALPVDEEADNIRIWGKVLISGPIISIIMGCIFLPIGIVTENIVLLLLGAMPLGMGIVSGLPIPLKTGITYTDGGRWSRLRKEGSQGSSEEIAIFKMMLFDQFKKDDTKMNYSDFEPLLNAKLDALRYYGYYYAYRYYKANKYDVNAESSLEVINGMKKKVSSIVIKDCNK